ncbi:MAG: hypothetical protein AAB353_13135 [Candidatus Hydrogenedentota bacterium]
MATRAVLKAAGVFAAAALGATGFLLAESKKPIGPPAEPQIQLSLTEWGSDHVGKPIPEYTTGEECLFCHRDKVGPLWPDNRHNHAMFMASADDAGIVAMTADEKLKSLVGEVSHVVGHTRARRFLKPNGKYGQMAMLNSKWIADGTLSPRDDAAWDIEAFANNCAGCHATAVETESRAYSAISLDCVTCHGNPPGEHTSDVSLVLFGTKSTAGGKVEMSVCASCHLRGGHSKTSGLPYANQFIPGDNLFLDFEVDLSKEYVAALNPGDRHVYQNVIDVLIGGKEEMTCVTCHDIHDMSSRKHRTLAKLQREEYCAMCHETPDHRTYIKYDVRSETCEY